MDIEMVVEALMFSSMSNTTLQSVVV